MSLATIAKAARNAIVRVEIAANRARGREYVPARSLFHLETTSACNLKCRFCAYDKKHSPRVAMPDAMFRDVVGQAVDMGYQRFELTPCTGDVFMDRHIYDKLEYLDRHAGVLSYEFFTNFTIPRPRDVERLIRLAKLRHLTVSVYGHDRDSFIAIAASSEKIYRRLVANLEALLDLLPQRNFGLAIGLRSTRHVPRRGASELLRLLRRFEDAGIRVRRSRVYNNWGGYVTQEDVAGLDIDITGADAIYKSGACALLLTTVQVMATGIVNGCACRDVDATLRIGDLKRQRLREILSSDNAAYMSLIDEQQRGEFRPICRSCDFYKSIYHVRWKQRGGEVPMQTLAEFKASLGSGGGVSRA
jgi:MoaA/NifB/PqqE/SkfB family radical SAM enzyme